MDRLKDDTDDNDDDYYYKVVDNVVDRSVRHDGQQVDDSVFFFFVGLFLALLPAFISLGGPLFVCQRLSSHSAERPRWKKCHNSLD